MRPPEKQQTKTQWSYLATTIGSLLSVFEVDSEALAANLEAQYGSTGLRTLMALSRDA
jgi:hypothetical protein